METKRRSPGRHRTTAKRGDTDIAALMSNTQRLEGLTGWLLGLAVLAFTLYVNRAWLLEEHRRLEPWRIACIWLNDATAVFWYV